MGAGLGCAELPVFGAHSHARRAVLTPSALSDCEAFFTEPLAAQVGEKDGPRREKTGEEVTVTSKCAFLCGVPWVFAWVFDQIPVIPKDLRRFRGTGQLPGDARG